MKEARSLQLVGPERLEWQVQTLPELGDREVLVRTIACAVSIGSEIPLYQGDPLAQRSLRYPRPMGYESVGQVVACGNDVTGVQVGDRVVGFYGQRDYAICPARNVIGVPGDVPSAVALLVILSCDAAKGVFKVRPKVSEPALIAGLGTMGLLTAHFLREYFGLPQVDAIEPDAERGAVGRRFGIRRVFSAEPPPARYDVAFECSGRNEGFGALQRALRPRGRLCVLSDGNYDVLALQPAFYEKELQVVGSSDGWDYHAHARWFFRHAPKTPYLSDLFQAQIDAAELVRCYADLAHGRIRPLKVLVTY